jgi:RNA polymerase sigma factor (sigma-70 family)
MTEWDVEELVGRVEQRLSEKFSVKYDSTQGPVKPWVTKIVFNEGNDLLREIIRKDEVYKAYESEISEKSYSDAADDELYVNELEDKWQSYLSHLEGDKRNIMQWTRDGLKPAEIAEELGITPERVYSVLCKERKKLERLFGRR